MQTIKCQYNTLLGTEFEVEIPDSVPEADADAYLLDHWEELVEPNIQTHLLESCDSNFHVLSATPMETYEISKRVTTVEYRRVVAPKGLTFEQLSEWVDEHGDGDLYDVDDIEDYMFYAEREDGSQVESGESE